MELETTQRRLSVRRDGLWHGRYRVGRLRRWTACRVLDVSMGGAAIEVHDEPRAPGTVLRFELRPVGVAVGPVRVRAEIRHVRRLVAGSAHVGLEFVDIPASERTTLDRMLRLFAL